MTGILYFLRFALPALTLVEQYSLGAADTVNAGRHNSACISRTLAAWIKASHIRLEKLVSDDAHGRRASRFGCCEKSII